MGRKLILLLGLTLIVSCLFISPSQPPENTKFVSDWIDSQSDITHDNTSYDKYLDRELQRQENERRQEYYRYLNRYR